jgi:uncharacterized protein YdbL (DUF1318 family)
MNKLLPIAFLLSSLMSLQAFAADVDLAPGNELDGKFAATDLASADDFTSRSAEIAKIVQGNKRFDENVALVNQITADGHVSLANVVQSGHGNFAAVNQDARTNPAVAMVFQVGGARAVVNQR